MLSDSVLNTLITTVGTTITTVAVLWSRRSVNNRVREVHDAVNEGRREAIMNNASLEPETKFPADIARPPFKER